MPSMTDSQFKTFRADVRREVHRIADDIRRDIYESVVGESRKVAAAVVRKDLPGKIEEVIGRKVSIAVEGDPEMQQRITMLENSVAQLSKELRDTRAEHSVFMRRTVEHDQRIKENQRVSEARNLDRRESIENLQRQMDTVLRKVLKTPKKTEVSATNRPKDGQHYMDPTGQCFIWWWGEWRRAEAVSEFASFAKRHGYTS